MQTCLYARGKLLGRSIRNSKAKGVVQEGMLQVGRGLRIRKNGCPGSAGRKTRPISIPVHQTCTLIAHSSSPPNILRQSFSKKHSILACACVAGTNANQLLFFLFPSPCLEQGGSFQQLLHPHCPATLPPTHWLPAAVSSQLKHKLVDRSSSPFPLCCETSQPPISSLIYTAARECLTLSRGQEGMLEAAACCSWQACAL